MSIFTCRYSFKQKSNYPRESLTSLMHRVTLVLGTPEPIFALTTNAGNWGHTPEWGLGRWLLSTSEGVTLFPPKRMLLEEALETVLTDLSQDPLCATLDLPVVRKELEKVLYGFTETFPHVGGRSPQRITEPQCREANEFLTAQSFALRPGSQEVSYLAPSP